MAKDEELNEKMLREMVAKQFREAAEKRAKMTPAEQRKEDRELAAEVRRAQAAERARIRGDYARAEREEQKGFERDFQRASKKYNRTVKRHGANSKKARAAKAKLDKHKKAAKGGCAVLTLIGATLVTATGWGAAELVLAVIG